MKPKKGQWLYNPAKDKVMGQVVRVMSDGRVAIKSAGVAGLTFYTREESIKMGMYELLEEDPREVAKVIAEKHNRDVKVRKKKRKGLFEYVKVERSS